MNFYLKKNPKEVNILNEKSLFDRILEISRVTKVTKGGKKLSFKVIVVIGDKKGKVGVGIGKADEIPAAIKKAKLNAKKYLIDVPLTKINTIPHAISQNLGACRVILRPSFEGNGVIAGGAVRVVLEMTGIKNITAKQLGSDNLLNNARTTIEALKNLIIKK